MKILKVLIINYKFYGFINYVKIVFFELIYLFIFGKMDDYKIEKKYKITKKSKKVYNSPHIPTPYFFLKIIKSKLSFLNKNYIFIDFGCGAGRAIFFFKKKFNKLIGIDYSDNYSNFYKKLKNIDFINCDLRKISNVKKKIYKFKKKRKLLYFYDPFDSHLIIKLIKLLAFKNDIIVLINSNINNLNNFKILLRKKFLYKNKNILILKKLN